MIYENNLNRLQDTHGRLAYYHELYTELTTAIEDNARDILTNEQDIILLLIQLQKVSRDNQLVIDNLLTAYGNRQLERQHQEQLDGLY
jgi:hypothetical protein